MSAATALREIGRPVDDPASLARALDDLLAARPEPPTLLALGEPAHGVAAFPLLRNELLAHLVDRGYRSIALETDLFAAATVNDHITGGSADIDTVLATGFSHGFGSIPGNRELLDWLRAHNADRPPEDHVHFHGFDAPTEFSHAPSPRQFLTTVIDYLPAALRPNTTNGLDTLLGDAADWTNPAAMYDPAASIGDSDRARALRLLADDLASALHRAAPTLRATNPAAYDHTRTHARTAQGLLRYHAAMASPTPDRIGTLISLRAEMMADNLLAIRAQEQHRGPTLVFAHNTHLQRAQSALRLGADQVSWASAGALVALALGPRYLFLATDANPAPTPDTLPGLLADATTRRTLFPTEPLRAALPEPISAGDPIVRGHIPLTPADLERAEAIIFITDTDGQQHQYW